MTGNTSAVGAAARPQSALTLAGWATYGYSASQSRYFWSLRLHLITTPSGHNNPIGS